MNLHRNAACGSGGVGVFIHSHLYSSFIVDVLDKSNEGILWIYFKCKYSDFNFSIAICYLPPNESTRPNDQEKFFEDLIQQVYCNQSKGNTIICGDFNARCGSNTEYIEGVDDVKPRTVIDQTENHNGDLFCEFLSDINFAMVNGRIGVNDYTYISPRGKAVVDYICVPYEQLNNVLDFNVLRMSDIINDIGYNPNSIPDHSLLICELKCPKQTNEIHHEVQNVEKNKRNIRNIPDDFLINENVRQKVFDTIEKMEHSIQLDQNVQGAYNDFQDLLHKEMEDKLPIIRNKRNTRAKTFYKPYWCQTLQEQWDKACSCEKDWLNFRGPPQRKKILKEKYYTERKLFDRLNRKFKRKHKAEKENELHEQLESGNRRDFW